MFSDAENYFNPKSYWCIAPTPLLLKSLYFIIPLLVIVLVFLGVKIIRMVYLKDKSRKTSFDKKIKEKSVYFLVVFLSLFSYGIIGLDQNFYLLVFFIISLLFIGGFFFLEYFNIAKVEKEKWIWATALAVAFAGLFVYCQIMETVEYRKMKNSAEYQLYCPYRKLF